MLGILSIIHSKLSAIKKFFYSRKFLGAHNNLVFYPEDSTFTYSTITVGSNVFINKRAYFSGKIRIGDDVLFGPDVFITSGDHKYYKMGVPINKQGRVEPREVKIGNDVWIGAKVCILAGVTIGEGCIVGAGSVVVRDLPAYSICVGNPCRKIKERYDEDGLKYHLECMETNW